MSPPLSRRRLLTVGATAGVSSLSGCLSSVHSDWGASGTGVPSDNPDHELGLAYSKSSGSFTDESESETGWVHIVSDGESADLTFDARLCDSLGGVTPSLSNSHSTEYVLDFATTSASTTTTSPTSSSADATCQSGTHLTGGANVPSDWETLVVTVDGTRIQSLERSGTMPELRSLPDPIRSGDNQTSESSSSTDASSVSDDEATERALAAEEVYIRTQLKEASCTESWGLESYTGVETEATVSERTADGVRVSVTHPYWYSTATTEADGASRATYLVTAESIQRVDGDSIISC
ncbi:hypothetical protein [Candidatus Halobonum tyrrellensis]|uniref:hypothetical protein n=1 Tax=Candidatus Halobonum tyrrellensis TaxID=1431545 RepID=UPI001267E16E|nr:hypothetical protein [Candidatus Halobonum tyrrellensis]